MKYEIYYRPRLGRFDWFGLYPLSEFIHHDQQILFLMASSFKGSDHIEPPDREGPSYGDRLESGRGHVASTSKNMYGRP